MTDFQRALRSPRESPFRSTTFSPQPSVELSGETFPVIVSSRDQFTQCARASGFELESEWGVGLEEYRFFRRLPSAYFVRWAETVGRAPVFPVRFARLGVRRSSDPPFPPGDWILACPRCRSNLKSPGARGSVRCPTCSFVGDFREGILDLRYLSPATQRAGPGVVADAGRPVVGLGNTGLPPSLRRTRNFPAEPRSEPFLPSTKDCD